MFENPIVNLSALRDWCAMTACCSSELVFTFVYAGSSIQNASEQFVSSINLPFASFTVHPTPQTKSRASEKPEERKGARDSNRSR
jgi:hypothetical protein